MKSKVLKTGALSLISFLAFYVFACLIAAVVALGMLLMPLVIIGIVIVAIREIIRWSRKTKEVQQRSRMIVKPQPGAIVKDMPRYRPVGKAA